MFMALSLNPAVSCASLLLGELICETSGVRGGQKCGGNRLIAFGAEAHPEPRLKLARDGEGKEAECSVWILPPG